jgi:hypothetical protein
MKLTLELDNGWRQSIVVEGLVPTLEDLEGMASMLDMWHQAMKAEHGKDRD